MDRQRYESAVNLLAQAEELHVRMKALCAAGNETDFYRLNEEFEAIQKRLSVALTDA